MMQEQKIVLFPPAYERVSEMECDGVLNYTVIFAFQIQWHSLISQESCGEGATPPQKLAPDRRGADNNKG